MIDWGFVRGITTIALILVGIGYIIGITHAERIIKKHSTKTKLCAEEEKQ